MVDKAVPLQSLDASEDVVPVVAWSCWVDSQDTSVCQDLLQLGAADQGKPAIPKTNKLCSVQLQTFTDPPQSQQRWSNLTVKVKNVVHPREGTQIKTALLEYKNHNKMMTDVKQQLAFHFVCYKCNAINSFTTNSEDYLSMDT